MSSKRRIRRRQCGKKARYRTMGAAHEDCRRKRARGVMVRPYGCTWCGHIHIGHFQNDELPEVQS